jgi:hypothetical protein
MSANGKTLAAIAVERDPLGSAGAMLGLGDLGLTITRVQIYGTGPNAEVVIHLSGPLPNGLATATVSRQGIISKPAMFNSEWVSLTTIWRKFTGDQCGQVASALGRAAEHHARSTMEDKGREWGWEFLRLAIRLDVDVSDQDERYGAFVELANANPDGGHEDFGPRRSAHAFARACPVLYAKNGERWVRAGWFETYVRRDAGRAPDNLATLMERIGWRRPGREGWIKATPTTGDRPLKWRFYEVARGWGADAHA